MLNCDCAWGLGKIHLSIIGIGYLKVVFMRMTAWLLAIFMGLNFLLCVDDTHAILALLFFGHRGVAVCCHGDSGYWILSSNIESLIKQLSGGNLCDRVLGCRWKNLCWPWWKIEKQSEYSRRQHMGVHRVNTRKLIHSLESCIEPG